jgi:hypothetical protein
MATIGVDGDPQDVRMKASKSNVARKRRGVGKVSILKRKDELNRFCCLGQGQAVQVAELLESFSAYPNQSKSA